jgi:SAM-dependent methyltransferase
VNEIFQIPLEVAKNIGASMPFLRRLKEKYSQRRIDLLEDMDRFFNVFEKLLDRCNGKIDLKDKVVLEIGPGNSLAIGLLFLGYGAKKVFLVDRFKHLFWDEHDIVYHKKVLEQIKEKDFHFSSVASEAIVSMTNHSIDLDNNKLEYRFGDAANLPLDNCSVDMVFSNAVLEHVHDVRKAISEMGRVTKPDGFGIHEIDLRDHFFQATPLRLLRYPDWLWNLMTWNRPGYTNRFLLTDYLEIFKASGFLIKKLASTREYEGELSGLKMARKFKGYSYNEMKTLAFWVLLQKEDGSAT